MLWHRKYGLFSRKCFNNVFYFDGITLTTLTKFLVRESRINFFIRQSIYEQKRVAYWQWCISILLFLSKKNQTRIIYLKAEIVKL